MKKDKKKEECDCDCKTWEECGCSHPEQSRMGECGGECGCVSKPGEKQLKKTGVSEVKQSSADKSSEDSWGGCCGGGCCN